LLSCDATLPILPLTALVGTEPSVLPLAREMKLFATLTPSADAAFPIDGAAVLPSGLAVGALVTAHRAEL
jgi:hypothetical protein